MVAKWSDSIIVFIENDSFSCRWKCLLTFPHTENPVILYVAYESIVFYFKRSFCDGLKGEPDHIISDDEIKQYFHKDEMMQYIID